MFSENKGFPSVTLTLIACLCHLLIIIASRLGPGQAQLKVWPNLELDYLHRLYALKNSLKKLILKKREAQWLINRLFGLR